MGLSETFGFEEKWMRLCLKTVNVDPNIFKPEYIQEAQRLLGGLGNRQVLALKDWARASGLIRQKHSSVFELTPIGQLLVTYDPNLEENASYWVIHHGLCMNPDDIWFYAHYANSFSVGKFSREYLKQSMLKIRALSESVIEKKCITPLLHTMKATRLGDTLGLLARSEDGSYLRRSPDKNSLPVTIVAYMILDWASKANRTTLNIAELFQPGNVGTYLGIDRGTLDDILDDTQEMYSGRILHISRTAGLNSISISRGIQPLTVLRAYYMELNNGIEPTKAIEESQKNGVILGE